MPAWQPLHWPAPLPLPTMKAHRTTKLASSAGLRAALAKELSVVPNTGDAGLDVGKRWVVTAQARMPGARLTAPNATLAALQVWPVRSEEYTSELQSLRHLVCR